MTDKQRIEHLLGILHLNQDEIVLIENLELLPPIMELAKDMFLFSFYCWGMRFRDVALLKKENVKGNMLTYTTSKSGFSKRLTIQMNDKCILIIKKHSTDGEFLFPLLKHKYDDPLKYEHAVSSINSVLNKSLKSIAIKAKIDKIISFHTARHSFVDILKKKGLPIEMRMQLVGHTSEKVHKQYHGDFDYEEMSKIVNTMI